MGETYEAPRDHTLADSEPHLGYATEGQAFGGIPLPNTLGGPSVSATTTTLTFCGGKTTSYHGGKGKILSYR